MTDEFEPNREFSEIIEHQDQLILDVSQTEDYVYPNEIFEYEVFIKNTSSHQIDNIHLQIINSAIVLIDQDDKNEGIEIGSLRPQEAGLYKIKARCITIGEYTTHFILYGNHTGIFTQKLLIHCDYNTYNANTTHRIHIYNFTPYEKTYMLQSEDYNEDVTRLVKVQKLPYEAKNNPFSFIKEDLHNGFVADESQAYVDQKNILYGNPEDSDEHTYQYIGRENFNIDSVEHFEGRNLVDIINQINENSKLFNAKFLKSGNNELLRDFQEYSPDGFIYRFGLLSSELFHTLGVLPTYSYMSDLLFRWEPDDTLPTNLYPKHTGFKWGTKKWAGHGWNVYKIYTEEYKNEIINTAEYTPCFEFIQNFEDLTTAEEYINKEYEYDRSNEYYTNIDGEMQRIRKYQYIIKESYADTGVFYIHIPLDKIPSNFYLPTSEEIEAIIQKTKPYGLKPLIRYVHTVRFNHNMSFKSYMKMKPLIKIDLDGLQKLNYFIQSYEYKDVLEDICYIDENEEEQHTTRESLRLVPYGQSLYNAARFYHDVKAKLHIDEMKNKQGLNMDMSMDTTLKSCTTDNNLANLNNIIDLLYSSNYNAMSFRIKGPIPLFMAPTTPNIPLIEGVNYKLWVESLQDNRHSHIWDLNFDDDLQQYHVISEERSNRIDFVEMMFTNIQLTQAGIESGIGFTDSTGKLHGISVEYNPNVEFYNIKYTTSKNNNYKIHKEIYADIDSIAYKIVLKESSTVILFFFRQKEGNTIYYNYLHHVVVPRLKNFFCFTRNDKDISSIGKWSNIVNIGKNINNKIEFNTPSFYNNTTPEYLILNEDISSWNNLSRIDTNEYSYAEKHNTESLPVHVDDILLHFDNISIPEDAIVKNIQLNAIVETNTNKSIYHALRIQDGVITPDSSINKISMYPTLIEVYPSYNKNTKYYQEQYDIAVANNVKQSITYFEDKLKENNQFNSQMGFSADFINNLDDYINVIKPHWIEFGGITSEDNVFNDIEDYEFVIEGYNTGRQINLDTKLIYDNIEGNVTETTIPVGYFKKHIKVSGKNNFVLSDTNVKIRFKGVNSPIQIFDVYSNITFKEKQDYRISYEEENSFDVERKQSISFNLLQNETLSYNLQNGLTVKLSFDDLNQGEYYRIYSVDVDIIYQQQSIDILAELNNKASEEFEDDIFVSNADKNFVMVSGQIEDAYPSGMFFDDLPSVHQLESTNNSDNNGLKLSDTIYQSFIAEKDNITSITLYPNGFVGNPSSQLKIGLYKNQGKTPSKMIKEVLVGGWSKTNQKLKDRSEIKYNFNVNNLTIGETYWLKIEVMDNPDDNNYYLLKYIDTPQTDFKLLLKSDNNFINGFGALKFKVNSINLYKSFNNIPSSQFLLTNPNIFIGLYRGQGIIKNLKIKK